MLSKVSRHHIILFVLFVLLLYTRLVNLDWGLPYPFHPDERNMADSITRLSCTFDSGVTLYENAQNCLNPEFFAYGQAPLYVSYLGIRAWQLFSGTFGEPIYFSTAAFALRVQSVIWSVLTVLVMLKIVKVILLTLPRKYTLISDKTIEYLALLTFIFQPYFIQFSHFGTTESLLMFLYSVIILLSLRLLEKVTYKKIILLGIILGISLGVKISSAVFSVLPGLVLMYTTFTDATQKNFRSKVQWLARMALLIIFFAGVAFAVTSPHYVLNMQDFLWSMTYEVGVGDGSIRVFYTRQFEESIPGLFQFVKVFPYSQGYLGFLIFVFGFFLLPWKNARVNILRIAFIVFFAATASFYTKWGRFVAPVMPVMTLIAFVYVIFAAHRRNWNSVRIGSLIAGIVMMTMYGLGYLSVYTSRDVRYEVSEWMMQNIAPGSEVLIETGNVINIPVQDPDNLIRMPLTYKVTPIHLYDADVNQEIAIQMYDEIQTADYVVIASRRVFANHTCMLPEGVSRLTYASPLVTGRLSNSCDEKLLRYPAVHSFFNELWNSDRFEKVAEFSSYPQISLFGNTIMTFEDEFAEEAWTVFDHPVVRVYKRL